MLENPEIQGGALLVREVSNESGSVTTVAVLPQYTRVMIYLLLSAACLLAGAIINLVKSRVLSAHENDLGLHRA